ncbi:MAG: M48 family metalloprotease [Holosporaceae bacterium]|jgi:predicted Zn-dependent protease|nr:M48 family metalloprotease [Holosporaceae bacterium]
MRTARIFVISILFCVSINVYANLQIIRDAEIEETLAEIVKPIFSVAGLRQESAKIFVINSNIINAFTIGNGYIFVTSELLLHFENPLPLIGILCHETGHIAAGHINRHIGLLQQRANSFMVVMLAGILGAALTGSQDMIALLLGYAMTDERFYLKFSRGEELAADALAVSYLEKLGYSADVLIESFYTFQQMEILNGDANLPVYIMTHPKTNDRISALQKYAKNKRYVAKENTLKKYKRLIIKLKAYLRKPDLSTQIPGDNYSRAIYFHRTGQTKKAIALLQDLLKKSPNDLYYKETLAQTFYESGLLDESIKIYEQILGNNVNILIKIDYANVLIEANKKIDKAISILESAKYMDHLNSDIFRLLAKAYGKKGKEGLSFFMLAQEQIFLHNYKNAHELLVNSLNKLDKKTETLQYKKAKYLKELIERDYKQYL